MAVACFISHNWMGGTALPYLPAKFSGVQFGFQYGLEIV
jgi:hypothetical protein